MKFKKATIKEVNIITNIEWESEYKWDRNKKECAKLAQELFDGRPSQVYFMHHKKPIGYFALELKKGHKCELSYFGIKKKYQGKGFGKIMMKKAIDIAKKEKCKEVELGVWGKNFPAIALYNKFGFYVVDIMKDRYAIGEHKLKMRKDIK